ncbi:hypothetical protein TorRG33x02_245570 [Trema orientale]|uniref:Neprosin PEP catalytic domain-containing protein n=1 Tax=Trema orientale TaxID=63057 RepID=A0A2P5DPQ6_TREOI|nr:hypothetical protein TorRG33x02_245570 [Trema orientale]
MAIKGFFLFAIVCYVSYYGKARGEHGRLSREEELEIEKQLKLLNKRSLKTIKTQSGDVYDCIFYKQPAFDHPLLKNHSYHFQTRPSWHPKKMKNAREPSNMVQKVSLEVGLKSGGCPIGTVPIRRTTKEDLIRAKLFTQTYASRISPLTVEKPGLHHAVVRTKSNPSKKYNGGGAIVSIFSLPVTSSQYSSGQMTIRNGLDSIQVGWTAGESSCFNTQCPGFIIVDTEIPLDKVVEPISQRGKLIIEVKLFVYRDQFSGNWWLELGSDYTKIGFWPSKIFSGGLKDLATYVEWGGEAYSPPGQPSPPMGSGFFLQGYTKMDAYCRILTTVNEAHEPDDAENTEMFVDDSHSYMVDDWGKRGSARHLMTYGGPGSS